MNNVTKMDYRKEYTKYDGAKLGMFGILSPIIVSFVVVFLYAIVGGIVGKTAEEILHIAPVAYLTSFVTEAGFVVVYILYNKINRVNWVTASNVKCKTHYLNYAFAIILGVGLPFFFSDLIGYWEQFIKFIGYNVSDGLGVPFNSVGDLLLTIVFMAFVPAIFEELLFRGAVLNGLRKIGKWSSILLSSLFFALMHNSLEQLPYTFILGVIIGYVVYQTRNIWLGMIIHFCNNAFVLIMSYISRNDTTVASSDVWVNVGMTALHVVLGIGIIIFVFYLMKKIMNKKNNIEDKTADVGGNQQDASQQNETFVIVNGEQMPVMELENKKTKSMLIATAFIGTVLLLIDVFGNIYG